MAKFPFIGPSYTSRSVNFDCQRAVNIFPVMSESGTSKNISALCGTPGLMTFCTFPTYPNRQSIEIAGRAFAVSGNALYEVFSDGTYLARGTLQTAAGPISMSYNASQICIVDGPNGYILNLTTNAFQQITSPGWLGADTVTYMDGYFIFNRPNTGVYYISEINDGTNIDALDFASAEGSPDNLVAVAAVHRQLFLFGTASIEASFNSGNPDFPFERIQGAFIEYGCIAAQSVTTTANTVFWLGGDAQGSGIVFMANGFNPQRISNFAVEYAIQQYGTLSDAVGYTYQEDGHYFYVLNFTSANTTWVYDISTNQWHERAYLSAGVYTRHRGQCHMYAFGKHLVGDYDNGILYQQALSIYDDNGNPKRWMRTCPHIADDLEYIFYDRLQIDMETGVGLSGSPGIQDTDPQVMLQWSDDGGHTWSNEHWVPAGKIGEYKARALWRRLGRSRDRVFSAAGSFNCKTFLINGLINPKQGAN